MIDKCRAVGGMRIGRGTPNYTVKINPLPLCPPQIPYDLGSNPFHSSGKPTTNHLGYGTAFDHRFLYVWAACSQKS
jgi:hypothetical protein